MTAATDALARARAELYAAEEMGSPEVDVAQAAVEQAEEAVRAEGPFGRCIGCFHDFTFGDCGGCGARPGPEEQCPGDCAEDCPKCGSSEPILWCDDCRAYATSNA